MTSYLPNLALTRKSFPCNLKFSSPYQIQDFAKKFIFWYFMNIYHTQSSKFPSFHPDHLLLIGLTINPSRDITKEEMWYLWCLTILYGTKLVFHVQAMFRCLTDPIQAHSLLWTLFEWVSPLSWWSKQLSLIINHHHLNLHLDQEGEQFTSIFIIHRPYFRHTITKLFWTQDQAYKWKIVPHSFLLTHDPNLVSTLKNHPLKLNHIQPTPTDIQHTSLGPYHELMVIPTAKMPSSSNSPSTGILIKEERPNYTNILFQDSQDLWE